MQFPTMVLFVAGAVMQSAASSAATNAPPHHPCNPCQPLLQSVSIPELRIGALSFKDLNRSGKLEPYKDWRLSAEERAYDLVKRMTLEEKAGTMVHAIPATSGTAWVAGGKWVTEDLTALVLGSHITTLINELSTDPASMARQANQAQAIAEKGRLGIPLSFSSDPRNLSQYSPSRFVDTSNFSQWPLATGLAATGDEEIARRSGAAARQENRAVGIHIQLGPAMDLASDPRWARLNESFGRDPAVNGRMAKAYIEGVQGSSHGIDQHSVVAVAKHWVGYGANREGFDGLNHYGRHVDFRGVGMEERLQPFRSAFAANVGTVMTAYSVPPADTRLDDVEPPLKRVGAAFSEQLVNQLLRRRFAYQGVVMTDWFVVDDCDDDCMYGNALKHPTFKGFGTPWGVEQSSVHQRYKLALDAGVDQFGGNNEPQYIVDLVKRGEIDESRLDESVRRILLQKFKLGLFENALVDEEQAARIVGNPTVLKWAEQAQQRATVLLKNSNAILPLKTPQALKLYLVGISADAARQHGLNVVDRPELADVALMRLATPFETLHPHHVVGALQHEGSLAFTEDNQQLKQLKALAKTTPVIVSIFMDRPAIADQVIAHANAAIVDFGISDDALIALMTGTALPTGTLPFDLPGSMAEVENR